MGSTLAPLTRFQRYRTQRPKPVSDSARKVHVWNQEGAALRGKKGEAKGLGNFLESEHRLTDRLEGYSVSSGELVCKPNASPTAA